MTFLSFLPETFLLIFLFFTLIIMNFRYLSHRSILMAIAGASSVGLFYFLLRQDLAYFASPIEVILSDSLSYYGRILSLVVLAVFSLGFHYHRGLSFQTKQSSGLFLLFYSLFVAGIFQSNSIVFFLACSLGIYICSMNLIFLESARDEHWILLFRQRMLPVGVWSLVVILLFAAGASLFGSIYISDWVNGFSKWAGSDIQLFVFGFLVLLAGVFPLAALRHEGRAPVGLAVLTFGSYLILSAFWLRVGIPFFSLAGLLSKTSAQALFSIILGVSALRFAWITLRTREHHRWFSSATATAVTLSLFLILLSSEQSAGAFFCITLALLFTFAFASHAFLDNEYGQKGPLLFSVCALLGAPPLILGEQFYRLVHEIVGAGNWSAGVLMMVSWFVFMAAAVQMMTKIMLARVSFGARRKVLWSELLFFSLYLFCVISLTAFRPVFVSFLNEHPVSNLW